MPPELPAPETVVAAAAERATENDYHSIKKHKTSVEEMDNEDNDDDPLYESICGATASPVVTPESDGGYKNLCDPELGESSTL